MTLDHDSRFDLDAYVKLVESFWDGRVSQKTFEDTARLMGADAQTVESVIRNVRETDGISEGV